MSLRILSVPAADRLGAENLVGLMGTLESAAALVRAPCEAENAGALADAGATHPSLASRDSLTGPPTMVPGVPG